MEFLQNPYVIGWFWVLITLGVMWAWAYTSNQNKINAAKTYSQQLTSFLGREYDQAQNLGDKFIITKVMDPNKKYVMINGQDTKRYYKYPIKGTFLAYTGQSLSNGATLDEPFTPGEWQVVVGMFTTNDDLKNCTNTQKGNDNYYLDAAQVDTDDGKADLCYGYDDTISQVIVAGTPTTIANIKNNVFKTSSNVKEITVTDGTNNFSGLVITIK